MKKFIALALLALSFSSFASSLLEDSQDLRSCGGVVELKSYIENDGQEKFALQFESVSACSNVILSNGKSYKLTDKSGRYLNKNITLSQDAVAAAKSYAGLGLTLSSNTGSHSEAFVVRVSRSAPTSAPASIPRSAPAPEQDYGSQGW